MSLLVFLFYTKVSPIRPVNFIKKKRANLTETVIDKRIDNDDDDDDNFPPINPPLASFLHIDVCRRIMNSRVENGGNVQRAKPGPTFKSNRSVIKLLRELTFPRAFPLPCALRVSRSKIVALHLPLSLSLTSSHLLALVPFHGANTSSSGTSATPAKNYGFKEPREIYVVFIPESFFAFSSIARA